MNTLKLLIYFLLLGYSVDSFAVIPTCRIVEKLGEDLRSNLQSKTNTALWYATGEKIIFSAECLKKQGKKQKPPVTSGWAMALTEPVKTKSNLCIATAFDFKYEQGTWLQQPQWHRAVAPAKDDNCKSINAESYTVLASDIEDYSLIKLLTQSTHLLADYAKREPISTKGFRLKYIKFDQDPEEPASTVLVFGFDSKDYSFEIIANTDSSGNVVYRDMRRFIP